MIRCARCGHACSPEAWQAAPALHTLTQAEVGAYVLDWPRDRRVEVRACPRCGRGIARTAKVDLASLA